LFSVSPIIEQKVTYTCATKRRSQTLRIYGEGGIRAQCMKQSFGETLLTEENRSRLEQKTTPVPLCVPQIPYAVTLDVNARIYRSGQRVSSTLINSEPTQAK